MCIRDRTNVALSTSRTERSQLSDRLAQLENSLAQAQTRIAALEPVSYTHLDVYKRQPWNRTPKLTPP